MAKHTCEHSGATFDIKDEKQDQIDKLTEMNQKLSLVLGYAMGFIKSPIIGDTSIDEVYLKYKWIIEAIENIIYLDKPLPRMP